MKLAEQAVQGDPTGSIAKPSGSRESGERLSLATFAGGCFWGPQVLFDRIDGVQYTSVGYTQGQTQWPNYGEVRKEGKRGLCTGHYNTGWKGGDA